MAPSCLSGIPHGDHAAIVRENGIPCILGGTGRRGAGQVGRKRLEGPHGARRCETAARRGGFIQCSVMFIRARRLRADARGVVIV